MQLFVEILNWMTNSTDPDQTAPSGAVWFGSALFVFKVLAILSETLMYETLGQPLSRKYL